MEWKPDLRKDEVKGMNWIYLAQDKDLWQDSVNTVMSNRVS
jgi:hypothetical protein